MATPNISQEMQDCIPYIKALSVYGLDKAEWFEKLSKLSIDNLISLMTIMEIGRDHYLMDSYKTRPNPELLYKQHKRVAIKHHQNKRKADLINCILEKLLLHRYMETAFLVLGLYKISA